MKCEHACLYQRPCRLCLLDTVKELEFGIKSVQGLDGQKIDELGKRVDELETVLKLVQRWGKDSRSVGAWEVFQEVAKVLDPAPSREVTVMDCTCVPCVCFPFGGNRCLGCGARTCMAHELVLKA